MSGPARLSPEGSVVTVGSFDGVHLGHQAIIARVAERAAAIGGVGVLVTFEPHPGSVLARGSAPARLTTAVERTELAAELGLDRMVVLRFDAAMAALSAERFVTEVLLARCGMKELVLGADHGFGHGRGADRQNLPALGQRFGFAVSVVEPVPDARAEPISSTRIRAALAAGELGRVSEWLGRPYRISARVVQGAGRGRAIGMPTINLEGPQAEKALPPDGVYAALVEWGGGTAGAMLNQGPRPTVGDARRTLEAHLFGVSQDLYGRMVRLEWVERLRDVQRFPSLDALRAQLAQDRDAALRILARPR
ncbi:MAG TPA: bifunctional riboflavin kinase/FAD synthetase [Gemmatimonadales bacterium]|nr:bifunctional riboflavin kinase/FAD synthetase [Gemmatimonadales bacterium]